jgi:Mg-chelatase subunit ChlI
VFTPWVSKSPSPSTNHLDRILCIYGIKGCGKSVLAKSIAERLNDRGEITLHFSFWAGSEAQRKLLDLLRTILWQLLNHLPDVKVQQLSTPLVTEPCLNEQNVLGGIHKALRLVNSDTYCIIDGIDESTDNWTSRGNKCL